MTQKRLGRNDPCRCGSGKKYKHCHLAEDERAEEEPNAPALPRSPEYFERMRSVVGPPQMRSDEVGPPRRS